MRRVNNLKSGREIGRTKQVNGGNYTWLSRTPLPNGAVLTLASGLRGEAEDPHMLYTTAAGQILKCRLQDVIRGTNLEDCRCGDDFILPDTLVVDYVRFSSHKYHIEDYLEFDRVINGEWSVQALREDGTVKRGAQPKLRYKFIGQLK